MSFRTLFSNRRIQTVLAIVASFAAPQFLYAQSGSIEGQITGSDKAAIAYVRVLITELGIETFADKDGRFVFPKVPIGTYTLSLSQGENETTQPNVQVTTGKAARVESTVDWPARVFIFVNVNAASRRPERAVYAPAAGSVLDSDEIGRESVNQQTPRLLADMPGLEVPQSGLYDFNPNVRGFNHMSNRHILTTIDGRDPSTPEVLGYTEWDAVIHGIDEMKSLEFVRGPGSALYGAGAFSGVLSVTTKSPRESLGGKARMVLGDMNAVGMDLRQAGSLGRDWYFKADAGFRRSDDFARSRVKDVEYRPDLVPTEPVPLQFDRIRIGYGNFRFDKQFANANTLTFEGGNTNSSGPVFTTGAGRAQLTSTNNPWGRVNFSRPNWNALGYYTGRDANNQILLGSGGKLFMDGYNFGLELQWNDYFQHGRGRAVAGISYGRQKVDSADPQDNQTILSKAATADRQGVFAQADYDLTRRLKGIASGRWDAGTLYSPSRFSPRTALVYSITPNHSLRASYNSAFQTPSLVEFFLRLPVAPPVDLSPLEQSLGPLLGSTSLGFKQIPLLAVGNENLPVEKIRSFEVGYNSVIGNRLSAGISVYRNWLENTDTNLLPQVGTSLGRLNPSYGAYRPPSNLSPQAAATVLSALSSVLPPSLFDALSNDANGSPVFALLSYKAFGKANTHGVELDVKYALNTRWRFQANYSLFDFSIEQEAPENRLVPNTPKHQAKAGILYTGKRVDASVRYRWVNSFPWSVGIYSGPVPSYSVVDSNVNYYIDRHWGIGVDAANFLNNEHYEMFGGDLLKRHILTYLAFSW